MKTLLLFLSLAPFLYFVIRDNIYHLHLRKVNLAEHLTHLVLGVSLFVTIKAAFIGPDPRTSYAFLLLGVAGSLDEFVFHRHLPAEEIDAHAKEHWTLFLFFIVAFLLRDW